jgi:hypothetical protein
MTKKALKLALEALKTIDDAMPFPVAKLAIKECTAALEAEDEIDWKDMYEKQKRRSEMWVAKYEKDIGPLERVGPQQETKDEPVAKFHVEHRTNACSEVCDEKGKVYATCDWTTEASKRAQLICDLLNTTPPQRTWVSLTEDEAIELLPEGDWEIESTLDFAKVIEAKLKEKNNG